MFSMTFNTYRHVLKRLLQRCKEVSSKTEGGCYKDFKGELRAEKKDKQGVGKTKRE